MRKKVVAGNWKMNQEFSAGIGLFSEIVNMVKDEVRGNQQVIVCPPYIHLNALAQLAKGVSNVAIGAQNCHQAVSGAYTGEISAQMIASVGAEYVILGHSERRQYFAEDETLLVQKLDAVFAAGLKPIYCIGETQEERESERHFEVIERQLKEGIFQVADDQFTQTLIAYEPVWAIGTGLTASPEQAQEVHAFIREQIARHYSQEIAENTTILYGGSCNPKNAAELFAQADIDGGLIGGASLKSRDFTDIIKTFNG